MIVSLVILLSLIHYSILSFVPGQVAIALVLLIATVSLGSKRISNKGSESAIMLNFTITTDGRSALLLAMRHFYRD